MATAIEKAGIPIVQITAVPSVSKSVGVGRVLRGSKIINPLGDSKLAKESEKKLMRKYVLQALEVLQTDLESGQVFTLEGTL